MEDPRTGVAEGPGSPPPLEGTKRELDDIAADLAALDEIEDQLGALDVALRRIDDGTYWTCEVCGGAIDEAVLAAAPLGRRCGRCAAG
jgi:RNA polymerase-binding transcription factor DksA